MSSNTKLFDPSNAPAIVKYKQKEDDTNRLTFDESTIITLADESETPVRELNLTSDESTTPCYCPFHQDNTASAFISRSKTGRYFIFCSACKAENRQSTFWCSNTTVTTVDDIQVFFDDKQGQAVMVRNLTQEERESKKMEAVKWFSNQNDLANFAFQSYNLKGAELKEWELSLGRNIFVFDPSDTPGMKPSNSKMKPGYYNRFASTKYLDMKRKSGTKFHINYLKHTTPFIYALLNNIFNNDLYIWYYMNFLAYIVQERKKPPVAFIMSTNQGAGKETLFRCILEPIFNAQHTAVLDIEEIAKEFNGYDFDKWCVIYDEANGSRFFEETRYTAKLNTMITSKENKIRELYQKPVWCKDYRFFTVFSNSEKPLPISDDDRRFYVIRNRESINMMKIPLYKDLTPSEDWSVIANKIAEELPTFAQLLHDMFLETTWIAKAQVTDAKEEMKDSLKTPMRRFADAVCAGRAEDIEGWYSIVFPSEKQEWVYDSSVGKNVPSQTTNFDRVECTEDISNHFIKGKYTDLLLVAVNSNKNKATRQEFQEHFKLVKKASGNVWYPKNYKE